MWFLQLSYEWPYDDTQDRIRRLAVLTCDVGFLDWNSLSAIGLVVSYKLVFQYTDQGTTTRGPAAAVLGALLPFPAEIIPVLESACCNNEQESTDTLELNETVRAVKVKDSPATMSYIWRMVTLVHAHSISVCFPMNDDSTQV